ncbi:hypothetical protein Q6300_28255, partial [Klebsiella pneumoniae]
LDPAAELIRPEPWHRGWGNRLAGQYSGSALGLIRRVLHGFQPYRRLAITKNLLGAVTDGPDMRITRTARSVDAYSLPTCNSCLLRQFNAR